MTERDNFLTRWSRRKLEAPDADASVAPERTDDPAAAARAETPAQNEEHKTAPPNDTAPTPEFDIAKLPSLDSITEATDVRAFLTPGVPPELTRAALRRAWAADPAIRNFVGLQENDWDFTAPNGPMGFGELPPGTDLKKLLARVFGEAEETAGDSGASDPAVTIPGRAQAAPETQESTAPARLAGDSSSSGSGSGDQALASPPAEIVAVAKPEDDLVRRDNIAATHNSSSNVSSNEPKVRRQHGRALPKY
jgi:hypothetical protein